VTADRPRALRGGAPTIREVAAAAGVSRATASRVINGGHLVSEPTRRAVEAAILDLGFSPNPAARSLATRRTGSVALVVPEPNSRLLTDPFFGGIINGLSLALDDSDLQMVLLIARQGASTERAAHYLTTGHVDGAVIASHHRDDALNRELVASGLPCVFIGRPLDVEGAHYVDMDNSLGARLATEHLISSGRRRIGTVAGPADMIAGVDRLVGWREAMEAAGRPTDAIEFGDFTARSGAEAMRRLLSAHPDLDAVFVASDLMASGALSHLASRGIHVPRDIAVFGFDDSGVAETTDPPLSTVAQPVGEMAMRAGNMLRALLNDEVLTQDPLLFRARLALRESA
jgi:DNA-binding LacI/PurR family transcriptional regulator